MVIFLYLMLVVPNIVLAVLHSHTNNIVILAGQSNMSGRGGVINATWDKFVPPVCQPNSAVVRLDAELAWVEAHEPIHKDIDVTKVCGVGPGLAFANSVLASDPSINKVKLVPCAIGGTSISQWGRGGTIYNATVERTLAAIQDGGILRALLWYQGESDTGSKEDAKMYKGRLERFFGDLRYDLKYPMLPIIQVAIASGSGPYVKEVREAQLEIDMVNVRCVDAKGLKLEPDSLHLTTSSQVRLGIMLADEFLRTLATPDRSHAPRRHQFLHF